MKNKHGKGKHDIYTLDWLPKKQKEDNQDVARTDNTPGPFFGDWEGNDWLILVLMLFAFSFVFAIFFFVSNSPTVVSSNLLQSGAQFASQGEYDQAIDCYTKAIAITPQNKEVLYIARGECYEAKGDSLAALADYDQVRSLSVFGTGALDRRHSLCLRLAEAEIQAGNLQKALDYYTHSLDIDDSFYIFSEWRYKFHCPRRFQTYAARRQCLINSDLENSNDPIHQLLATADLYWMGINNAYLVGDDEIVFHSLDRDGALLLGFAEWHYGQENYALALECLRWSIAKTEFLQLPSHLQETFRNLEKTLEEMLQEGVPPGVLSYTSSSFGMTITTVPPAVLSPQTQETESETKQ